MRYYFAFAIFSGFLVGCESLDVDRGSPIGGPGEEAAIAAAPPVQRDVNAAASARQQSAAAVRAETRVR